MSRHIRTAYSEMPTEAPLTDDIGPHANENVALYANANAGLHASWGQRVETVAATTSAVLVVAVIALLMGMPSRPGESSQAAFISRVCKQAGVELVAEAARLRAEEEQQAAQMRATGVFIYLYSASPYVTQACLAQ